MNQSVRPLFAALALLPVVCSAGKPADLLPAGIMTQMEVTATPVDNGAFAPGKDALPAPPFNGVVQTAPGPVAEPAGSHEAHRG
jgi:hypothetical protein